MDAEQIKAVLATVSGEGAEQDIVSAGLVEGIRIDGDDVEVTLAFPKGTPRAVRHDVEDAVYDALEDTDGVGEVTVDIVADAADLPEGKSTPAGQAQGQGQASARGGPAASRAQGRRTLDGVRNIIAVASGKGGVGKSTVAVNLALALKNRGARVGLLDIDVYGPSAPTLLGVPDARPGATPDHQRFLPVEAYGLRVMSIGFLLDDDTPVIWRGPIVNSVVTQFLNDVEWGELDYLVVDLPPGTGDAQLTLTQSVPITGAVIVTTPSELALIDAIKGLQMFRKVDTPVIGVVENMSHYACPSCGHESHPFNSGGVDRMVQQFGIRHLGAIPVDIDIQRGGDQGKPVSATAPDSPQAAAFVRVAEAVVDACPYEEASTEKKDKGGFLSSLFRR